MVGAHRADVGASGVAQLRNHLVAEGGDMPGPCVQTVHVASVSEELHSRKGSVSRPGETKEGEKEAEALMMQCSESARNKSLQDRRERRLEAV